MLNKDSGEDTAFPDERTCDIDAFKAIVSRETRLEDYPGAAEIAGNFPIYDGDALRAAGDDPVAVKRRKAEWYRAFSVGPGIIAIKRGYADTAIVDAVTDVLSEMIAEEERAGTGAGDHFAAAGANSRMWNSHEKLCVRAPELYARYNANPLVREVSEAWLGPAYQITTQVNVVRPGGKAQTGHRDYHMGFQPTELLRQYPANQHALSASLTLQGAVAHSNMSVEAGVTKLLPYSAGYLPGYIAIHLAQFQEYFEAHFVQVPLEKGDMLFFNPATFHAAGENRTSDEQRFGNLMQIGSGYGRSIEILDRVRMSKAVYPALLRLKQAGALSPTEVDTVVAATAEGYPFPANLDIDSPLSGMAPPSQQEVMRTALAENWDAARFEGALDEQQGRKRSH